MCTEIVARSLQLVADTTGRSLVEADALRLRFLALLPNELFGLAVRCAHSAAFARDLQAQPPPAAARHCPPSAARLRARPLECGTTSDLRTASSWRSLPNAAEQGLPSAARERSASSASPLRSCAPRCKPPDTRPRRRLRGRRTLRKSSAFCACAPSTQWSGCPLVWAKCSGPTGGGSRLLRAELRPTSRSFVRWCWCWPSCATRSCGSAERLSSSDAHRRNLRRLRAAQPKDLVNEKNGREAAQQPAHRLERRHDPQPTPEQQRCDAEHRGPAARLIGHDAFCRRVPDRGASQCLLSGRFRRCSRTRDRRELVRSRQRQEARRCPRHAAKRPALAAQREASRMRVLYLCVLGCAR